MRVSILVSENVIVIDGKGKALDCAGLRGRNISHVRWDGKRGDITYVGGGKGPLSSGAAFQPDGFLLQGLIDAARDFGASAKP
jgi:hypothetical protein